MPRMESGGLGLATNQPSRPRDASERHDGAQWTSASSRLRALRMHVRRRLGSGDRFDLGRGAERESGRSGLRRPRVARAASQREPPGSPWRRRWRGTGGFVGTKSAGCVGRRCADCGPVGTGPSVALSGARVLWTHRPRWGVLRSRLKHSGHRARVDSRAAPGKMREHEVAPHALVLFRARVRAQTPVVVRPRARTRAVIRRRRGSGPAVARGAACGSCTRAIRTGA
jgi:hypothetical protein